MNDKALAACKTISAIEALARRRTPMPLIDYIAAGSGNERTLRRNRAAFDDYDILPHVGRDVSKVDMSVQFMGRKLSFPMAVAPTGGLGLVRKDAELSVASAAAKAGILFTLSCVSAASLEDIAKVSNGPKVFQLYPLTDKKYTLELIDRAKAAGYDALCLTVDTGEIPGRPNSDKWGADSFADGKLPKLRTILAMARFPRRALDLRAQQNRGGLHIMAELAARGSAMDIRNDMRWQDWAELADYWGGPFFIKGVARGDDAAQAAALQPAAIVACNHGGTYIDGAAASVDTIEEIVAAVPRSVAVIQSGGIRSGIDLMTSLALGATLGMTGRPYLYGAAAAGEEGVLRAIEILKREFSVVMRNSGCTSVAEIDRSLVRKRHQMSETA